MTREYISTTPISERSDRVRSKIYHHLDLLKRGKLTLWLKNRMAWDAEVCGAVAEILMPAPRKPTIEALHLEHLKRAIARQFENESVLYKLFVDKR